MGSRFKGKKEGEKKSGMGRGERMALGNGVGEEYVPEGGIKRVWRLIVCDCGGEGFLGGEGTRVRGSDRNKKINNRN